MARVWKETLRPGTWRLPNGKSFRCTPGDIRHFAGRTQEMVRTGFPLFWYWDHQHLDEGDAASLSLSAEERWEKLARNSGGHVHDAREGEGGSLELLVDVPDDEVSQVSRVKFVSPFIRSNYTDPHGKTWPGASIIHLAVTPRPVQYPQKPFDFNAALSLAACGEPLCLSHAKYEDDMPEPKNKAADDRPAKPPVETPEEVEVTPEVVEPPVEPEMFDKGDPHFKAAIEALAAKGYKLGNDVSRENFFERLAIALMNRTDDDGQGDPTDPMNEQIEPAPVMMSMAEVEESKAPLLAELENVRAQNKALAKAVLATHPNGKAGLRNRIERLASTGRIDRETKHKFEEQLKTTTVALSQAGEPEPTKLTFLIEARETLPHNALGFAKGGSDAVALSQAEEAVAPPGLEDDAATYDPHVMYVLTGGQWKGEQK